MKNSSRLFACLFVISVIITPILAFNEVEEDYPRYMFKTDLLCLDTVEQRIRWTLIMQDQLRKIGINVRNIEITGGENIAPRTWRYPLIDYDYIPNYAEGGFDILFVGWNWEKDWDPTGFYDTDLTPWSNNFYQYNRSYYDVKLAEYLTTYNITEREMLAYDLQKILYKDLPAVSILYEKDMYLFNKDVKGINADLLHIRYDHAENWENTGSLELSYGSKYNMNVYNAFKIDNEDYTDFDTMFDSLWSQCVYGSLFQRNLTNHLWEPSIAKNATIESHLSHYGYIENISITVDLKPEAKFSNGEQVLAEDVKYSYDLHLAPEAHVYRSLVSRFLSTNDSVVVIDSNTVRFDFNDVFNFPYSVLSYGIIDKSTVEPIISTYGYDVFTQLPFSANVSDTLVTSCGPFKLENYNITEGKAELSNNEYWFGSPQKLNNITFRSIPSREDALKMLFEEEVDVLDATYEYLQSEAFNTYDDELPYDGVLCTPMSNQEMAFNLRHPMMGSGELTPLGTADAAKSLRQAISHAIPRQRIIDECLEGIGMLGVTPVPPGCIGFDPNLKPYTYDLDVAQDLVEEAGYNFFEIIVSDPDLLLIPLLIGLISTIFVKKKHLKN